jgi:hypothetical protein
LPGAYDDRVYEGLSVVKSSLIPSRLATKRGSVFSCRRNGRVERAETDLKVAVVVAGFPFVGILPCEFLQSAPN